MVCDCWLRLDYRLFYNNYVLANLYAALVVCLILDVTQLDKPKQKLDNS